VTPPRSTTPRCRAGNVSAADGADCVSDFARAQHRGPGWSASGSENPLVLCLALGRTASAPTDERPRQRSATAQPSQIAAVTALAPARVPREAVLAQGVVSGVPNPLTRPVEQARVDDLPDVARQALIVCSPGSPMTPDRCSKSSTSVDRAWLESRSEAQQLSGRSELPPAYASMGWRDPAAGSPSPRVYNASRPGSRWPGTGPAVHRPSGEGWDTRGAGVGGVRR
jgi:hypothetical protein